MEVSEQGSRRRKPGRDPWTRHVTSTYLFPKSLSCGIQFHTLLLRILGCGIRIDRVLCFREIPVHLQAENEGHQVRAAHGSLEKPAGPPEGTTGSGPPTRAGNSGLGRVMYSSSVVSALK